MYISGDTEYADHFKAIGEAYGPFDLTIIKVGAYAEQWPEIHINPEEAVQAHIEVKGKLLLPVHWATFNLALHPWDEPIIRTVKAAKENNVRLTTPFIQHRKPGPLGQVRDDRLRHRSNQFMVSGVRFQVSGTPQQNLDTEILSIK